MALPNNLCDREMDKFVAAPNGGQTAVRIFNSPSDPITVSLTSSTAGMNVFKDSSGTLSTPGIQQTLITYSVPVGKTHELKTLNLSTFQPGTIVIEAGGSIIGKMRSAASAINPTFKWEPGRSFSAGTLIEVKYTQRSGTAASDVDAYLMLIET